MRKMRTLYMINEALENYCVRSGLMSFTKGNNERRNKELIG
jgi:hypothetical protein